MGVYLYYLIVQEPPFLVSLFLKLFLPCFRSIGRCVKQQAWAQGSGRQTREDLEMMTIKDLDSVSEVMGESQFVMGNFISSVDYTLFGIMVQVGPCFSVIKNCLVKVATFFYFDKAMPDSSR